MKRAWQLLNLVGIAIVSFALGALGMWEYGWGAAEPPLPRGAKSSCYMVVWENGRCDVMYSGDSVAIQQRLNLGATK